jgi:hypothetical protein
MANIKDLTIRRRCQVSSRVIWTSDARIIDGGHLQKTRQRLELFRISVRIAWSS